MAHPTAGHRPAGSVTLCSRHNLRTTYASSADLPGVPALAPVPPPGRLNEGETDRCGGACARLPCFAGHVPIPGGVPNQPDYSGPRLRAGTAGRCRRAESIVRSVSGAKSCAIAQITACVRRSTPILRYAERM